MQRQRPPEPGTGDDVAHAESPQSRKWLLAWRQRLARGLADPHDLDQGHRFEDFAELRFRQHFGQAVERA
jgi:hypothetical protein